VYSKDEYFLDFTGLPQELTQYSLRLCKTVKQWTGIPISIGIAPTKTLAKLANRLAKKGHSRKRQVLDWQAVTDTEAVLAAVALDDLWGISQLRFNRAAFAGCHWLEEIFLPP